MAIPVNKIRAFVAGSEGVYLFPDVEDKRERLKFIGVINGRDLQTDQIYAKRLVEAYNAMFAEKGD